MGIYLSAGFSEGGKVGALCSFAKLEVVSALTHGCICRQDGRLGQAAESEGIHRSSMFKDIGVLH